MDVTPKGVAVIFLNDCLTNGVEEVLHVPGFVPNCRISAKSQGSPGGTAWWTALLGLPDLDLQSIDGGAGLANFCQAFRSSRAADGGGNAIAASPELTRADLVVAFPAVLGAAVAACPARPTCII